MATREKIETLIASASAHDGFQVKTVEVGNEHSLYLVFYQNGEPVNPPWLADNDPNVGQMIWCRRNMTDKDYGDKARLKLLADALCRFLNTCGTWAEIKYINSVLWDMSQGSFKFEIPGYHLIGSSVNTEGVYEHVFASPDAMWGIRWVENQFFDVISLTELGHEIADADADGRYVDPGRPSESAAGRPDEADSSLRHQGGAEAPPGVEGQPGQDLPRLGSDRP